MIQKSVLVFSEARYGLLELPMCDHRVGSLLSGVVTVVDKVD